jgi:hypothetical protein
MDDEYAEVEPQLLSGYQGMLERQATVPTYSRFKLKQAGEWIVHLYQDGDPGR